MDNTKRGLSQSIAVGLPDTAVDRKLRAFMIGVYNKVALGRLVSAGMAFVTSGVPEIRDLVQDRSRDPSFGRPDRPRRRDGAVAARGTSRLRDEGESEREARAGALLVDRHHHWRFPGCDVPGVHDPLVRYRLLLK